MFGWSIVWITLGPFVAIYAVFAMTMAVAKAALIYCGHPNLSWADAFFLGSISDTDYRVSKPFEIMWPLSKINTYDPERHQRLIQLTEGKQIDTDPRPSRRDR